MECVVCGAHVDEHARFCPGCGQRITVQRRVVPEVREEAPPREVPQRAPPQAFVSQPAPREATAQTLPRQELRAAMAARQELGDGLEPEVIDTFLSRVETAIDARVDARISGSPTVKKAKDKEGEGAIAVALGSFGLGIPLTAIAAGTTGIAGLLIAWGGIAAVNIAYNLRRKK